jgi:hypothetical protein
MYPILILMTLLAVALPVPTFQAPTPAPAFQPPAPTPTFVAVPVTAEVAPVASAVPATYAAPLVTGHWERRCGSGGCGGGGCGTVWVPDAISVPPAAPPKQVDPGEAAANAAAATLSTGKATPAEAAKLGEVIDQQANRVMRQQWEGSTCHMFDCRPHGAQLYDIHADGSKTLAPVQPAGASSTTRSRRGFRGRRLQPD